MPSQPERPAQAERQSIHVVTSSCSNASAYRPSILLLCALIFWTGISAISEMIIPPSAIIFSLITYAPTLHFAVQSIVRRSIQGVHAPDTCQASRRARILTAIWVLTVAVHTGLWLMDRHDAYAGIFLLPTIPGSQAILVMISIAIRYTIDIHMTSRERNLVVPRDTEESALIEPTSPLLQPEIEPTGSIHNSPQQDTEGTIATPTASLYQPSLFFLLISIFLPACSIVFELYLGPISPIIISLSAYIPTILLHAYLISKILRGEANTLKQTTTIAGLSFDLIPLWLGTRGLMLYFHYSETAGWPLVMLIYMLLGSMQTLLVTYFAFRYTQSVYAERRRQISTGVIKCREDNLLPPMYTSNDGHETSLITTQSTEFPIEPPTYYPPSTTLLILSIVLSTACAIIESLAEPVCGVPMSAIVYVPTVIIHFHFIYQQYCHHPNTDQTFNTSLERSMQLCLVWLLTQAFYVLVWPVSQYLKQKVMNPWVRWPEVVLIAYISARYIRERYIRNSGGIRLPPDSEEESASILEPPLHVANENPQ